MIPDSEDIRQNELNASLQATDLRDIADFNDLRAGKTDEDKEWADRFIISFRKYLDGQTKKKKNERLWSVGGIVKQFKNFIRGGSPTEPTNPNERAKAMRRLDSAMYEAHNRPSNFKEATEYIPTPMLGGSADALIRHIRQHSRGGGGVV